MDPSGLESPAGEAIARGEVGECALVAAGAVVRENFVVPAGTLAAGVPARVMRDLTREERRAIAQSAANYVAYAASSMTRTGYGASA